MVTWHYRICLAPLKRGVKLASNKLCCTLVTETPTYFPLTQLFMFRAQVQIEHSAEVQELLMCPYTHIHIHTGAS